eukprot:442082-Pyramimonas_sp.AAC.1
MRNPATHASNDRPRAKGEVEGRRPAMRSQQAALRETSVVAALELLWELGFVGCDGRLAMGGGAYSASIYPI